MSKWWKYIAVLVISAILISGCSSAYKPGQTVWIDLKGRTVASEGYAIAKVIKLDGDKAHLRVTKLKATAGNSLVRTLQRKKVVISASLLKPLKSGRAGWQARRKAGIQLARLLRTNKPNSKRETYVDKVAGEHEVPELVAALKLYRLKKSYLGPNLSRSKRIANVPYVLRQIKSLAQRHQAYNTVLDRLSRAPVYSANDGKRSVSVSIARGKYKRGQKRMRSNLFTRGAATTVRQIRSLLNSANTSRMKGLDVAANMTSYLQAETALLKFVTDNGKRYSRKKIADIVDIRKRQVAQAILPRVRNELIAKAELGKVRSEAEATSRYETAASTANDISKRLGVTVFPKYAKQRWFLAPVKARLARLAREQDARFKVAMNRKQSLASQDKAISRYLKDYPEGKYRNKIIAERANLEQRKKIAAEIHDRRLKTMMAMMQGKTQYKGRAGYRSKTLRFRLKINNYNKKTGRFTGRITWPQRKGAVNRIKGKVNSKSLSIEFAEVAVIRRGNWRPGSKYRLSMASDTGMKGTHSYKLLVFPGKRPASLALK